MTERGDSRDDERGPDAEGGGEGNEDDETDRYGRYLERLLDLLSFF